MPKGYVIITEEIHDPDRMREYEKASTAALLAYGGQVLAVDHDVTVIEGTWHGTRTVMVEYESVAQARAWYESSEYAPALPLRLQAATCNAVIVEGWEPPSARAGSAAPEG